ncbi:MAG TPA: hypothetical protein VLJ59_07945 [Mycobacteriales bacterium]|nr:hypothetical protein [Mycobacteriales bacterium]
MLRALAHPVLFAGLLVGFLLSVTVHYAAQAAVDRGAARRVFREVRRRPVTILDPFGAVAAALVGPGWGVSRTPVARGRGNRLAVLLAGPVAVLLLGGVAVGGYLAVGGPRFLLGLEGPATIIHVLPLPAAQSFLLALGVEALGVAVLSLVPLPPLTGWQILMLFAGRELGWQRARHYLEERNFGVLALLVLLILPIGVGGPILLELVDWAVGLLLGLVGS